MNRTTHRTLLCALAVSVALLASACGASGGSDDAATDDDTTTTVEKTTTTKATTTTVATDDAQARADSVDLAVSDFPDGWEASAPTPDEADNPLDACDPTFSDDGNKLAKHATDDFTLGVLDDGDGTQFAAETVIFSDADGAAAAIKVFDDTDVVACIDDALKTMLGEATGSTVTGSLEDDDIDVGTDESAGVSATYELTSDDGTTLNATVAVLAMSTGDVGTMVTILSLGDSLDPADLQAPIKTLAELQGAA